MSNNTTLVLIRHGKTLGNVNKLYYGATDLPLTTEGIAELHAYAAKELYPVTQLYFTTDMQRTNATFEILFPDTPHHKLPEFREYDFGAFEGYTYEELKDREDYRLWIADQTGDHPCPGGESRNSFVERITTALEALIGQIDGKSATLVCHGGVISIIMSALFPGKHNFYEWQPNNGLGYKIVISPNGVSYHPITEE